MGGFHKLVFEPGRHATRRPCIGSDRGALRGFVTGSQSKADLATRLRRSVARGARAAGPSERSTQRSPTARKSCVEEFRKDTRRALQIRSQAGSRACPVAALEGGQQRTAPDAGGQARGGRVAHGGHWGTCPERRGLGKPRFPRGKVVRPAGFEPTTFCSGGGRPLPLGERIWAVSRGKERSSVRKKAETSGF